jgi:hypothetical protein
LPKGGVKFIKNSQTLLFAAIHQDINYNLIAFIGWLLVAGMLSVPMKSRIQFFET